MKRSQDVRARISLAVATAVGMAIVTLPTFADPPTPPYRWDKAVLWDKKTGPEAREHGALIVDEEKERVILVGGSGYEPQLTPLADVWQFSLKSDKWTSLQPAEPIPSGGSRRVAQVPGQKVAYLFGGYTAGETTNNELVRVDFAKETPSFTLVPQDNPPSPRMLHSFVYDAKLDRFLLFAGLTFRDNEPVIHNDVWTMELANGRAKWSKLDLPESPSPRYGFFYGYDPENGRLIVFSGAQGVSPINPAQDTWLLSARSEPPTWKKWKNGKNGENGEPAGRRNGCFVYDPVEQRLFVFGGTKDAKSIEPDLSVFDAQPGREGWKTWQLPNGPPLRASGFGFHDRVGKRIVLGFGNAAKTYTDLSSLRY